MTTYYHGGAPGLAVGGKLLPPSVTGAPRCDQYGPTSHRAEVVKVYSSEHVYLCTAYEGALMFASLHHSRRGEVYRVMPEGEVEPDVDCRHPGLSWRCRSAVIVGRVKSDRKLMEQIRDELLRTLL